MLQLAVYACFMGGLAIVLVYLNHKMSKRFNDNWAKQDFRLENSLHVMRARRLQVIDGGRKEAHHQRLN